MPLRRTALAVCWVLSVPAAGAASDATSAVSLLQVGAGRDTLLQRATRRGQAGLRHGPDQAAIRTLLTLDANRDGRVDSSEVKKFAVSQGFDSASAIKEFAGLDSNGDGSLDSTELTVALGTAAVPARQESPMAQASVGAVSYSTQESAQKVASTVVDQLALEAQKAREAQALERQAMELRANSTELARRTEEMATEAAEQAASAKAAEVLRQLSDLEDKAKHAEIEAAALRAKAKAELDQADELMAVADQALKVQPAL